MKKSVIAILFFFSVSFAFAGDGSGKNKEKAANCSYTGFVLDAANAEALTGATVKIVELNKQVFTDFDGKFTLAEIPEGEYTLEISFISYDTKVIQSFEIKQESKAKRILI